VRGGEEGCRCEVCMVAEPVGADMAGAQSVRVDVASGEG